MQKLAFCFLIYDSINHEELWNRFFNGADQAKYKIYIHYKTDKPLKYFDKCKLTNCIPTKYCHVSIVHAHILLFKKAFMDGCTKIISLSQACIPLKSFDYIYEFLTKDDLCHFNISPQNKCFPRCRTLLNYYELETIQKSSNWFILNRNVCYSIVKRRKSDINIEYGNIVCPEEHYFITTVFANNLQSEVVMTPNLPDGATTFTNWEGGLYKYPSKKGLKNYSEIAEEELVYLLNSKSLFGRKFAPECALSLAIPAYITAITT